MLFSACLSPAPVASSSSFQPCSRRSRRSLIYSPLTPFLHPSSSRSLRLLLPLLRLCSSSFLIAALQPLSPIVSKRFRVRRKAPSRARHHRGQVRQPAVLSKLRSSAKGLLRLLSAMTASHPVSKIGRKETRKDRFCPFDPLFWDFRVKNPGKYDTEFVDRQQ